MTEMCHCGQPLHYTDPRAEKIVRTMIDQYGEKIPVSFQGRTWMVPRHYIALHGLEAKDLPNLGFQEVGGIG